ncbi:MAG: cobaltochelatase subunit CobN, partial [Proteobacteria bacterium]|nr:cobaltochelatase subunit CobN [Pseudomonadota bacterium]
EGACAKRRTSAVIIDHLTPPLTRAESYGPLRDLEALVDEYYEAAPLDARRADMLKTQIIALSTASDLAQDAGVSGADTDENLAKLDDYLCDLKEAQIRDGLHIFGCSPVGDLRRNLICALVRIARGDGVEGNNSLHRAIAADLALDFDPLDCVFSQPWQGLRPQILCDVSSDTWRSFGDTVERIEELCSVLLDDILADKTPPEIGDKTTAVLHQIKTIIAPLVDACGVQESANLMTALNARFIPPAPSGAPTRGRLDVLPTGRNFYSIDSRALPTPTAWALGWKSANLLIERHLQDHGDWPRAMLLTAWGTANMRTGGDDIAQALALMGVRPKWDSANRRVTGFEIIPIGALGRPRVDVTLRISGFF